MVLRVVRLGSARTEDEGIRIGTVRRPPRGVLKSDYASRDWYDIWYPNLAPSLDTMKAAQRASTARDWAAFTRKYRAEMSMPDARRTIELLAALSHHVNFSVGCYCENEAHCHRSILRELFVEMGAKVQAAP